MTEATDLGALQGEPKVNEGWSECCFISPSEVISSTTNVDAKIRRANAEVTIARVSHLLNPTQDQAEKRTSTSHCFRSFLLTYTAQISVFADLSPEARPE